jgi:hypothetical protein
MADPGSNHRVFLSYTKPDAHFAEQMRGLLTSFGIEVLRNDLNISGWIRYSRPLETTGYWSHYHHRSYWPCYPFQPLGGSRNRGLHKADEERSGCGFGWSDPAAPRGLFKTLLRSRTRPTTPSRPNFGRVRHLKEVD